MNKRKLISSILTIIILASSTSNVFALQVGYSKTRLGGSTRYSTAVEISKEFAKSDTITNVILVRNDDFADSISATSLSVYLNAPILLTQKDSLNDESVVAMKAMGIKNVYLLGGLGVISLEVESQLRSAGYSVTRYGGENRIETNRIIINSIPRDIWGPSPKLVNGFDWVQGMSVAFDTKYYNHDDNKTYINPIFVVDAATSTSDELKDIIDSLTPVQAAWESKSPGIYKVMLDSNILTNVYNNLPDVYKNIADISDKATIAKNLAYSQSVVTSILKPFGNVDTIFSGYKHVTTDANVYITSSYKDKLHSTNIPYLKHGVLLTSGDDFIDALAVTSLAGKFAEPIVMANNSPSKVLGRILSDDDVISYFSNIYDEVNNVYYIGGTAAVPLGSENYLNGN